jgi:enamine deaminase RidA (YjgF/YER057c/UK114 family)
MKLEERQMLTHLSPEGLHKNPAFTQAISVTGPHRTIYVGGQNAVDAGGNIIGKGDIQKQAEQTAQNLLTALSAGGAGLKDVVKMNINVIQGQSLQAAMIGAQSKLGRTEKPPTITVLYVSGLAHPDFLIEIDAIAVLDEKS